MDPRLPLAPALLELDGGCVGRLHVLEGSELEIGRSAAADLVVDVPGVSRRHAQLRLVDEQWLIVDLGSKNGTEVNGRRVDGQCALASQDLVKFGPVTMRFLSASDPERPVVEQLWRQAQTDRFTGLYTKTSFFEQAERVVARCQALSTSASLVVLDLDHFKDLNDRYGHPAGDQVLLAVANFLSDQAAPRRGICGRYGGEEFVLLFPAIGGAAALDLAEQLRTGIAALNIELSDKPAVRVTASLGVAEWLASVDSAAALFALADRALYEAKHRGRNRVCAAWSRAAADGVHDSAQNEEPTWP